MWKNHDRGKVGAGLELLRFCFWALGNGKRILLSVDVSVIAASVGQRRALSAQGTRQQQQDSRAKQIGLRAALLLLLQALYGKLFGKLNIKTMCTYATLMQFWPSKRAESRRGKNARHQIRELRGHTPRILNFCVCAAAQFRLRRGYCGFVRI